MFIIQQLALYGCNSFHFYIKPQLLEVVLDDLVRCNSFHFYIKPQLTGNRLGLSAVVIHFISTSNHNQCS